MACLTKVAPMCTENLSRTMSRTWLLVNCPSWQWRFQCHDPAFAAPFAAIRPCRSMSLAPRPCSCSLAGRGCLRQSGSGRTPEIQLARSAPTLPGSTMPARHSGCYGYPKVPLHQHAATGVADLGVAAICQLLNKADPGSKVPRRVRY